MFRKNKAKPVVPQRFPPPGPGTLALLVHFGIDGEEMISREFNTVDEADFLFSKMVMYARSSRTSATWKLAAQHGEGVELQHLMRWVDLRQLRVFEGLKGRLIATVVGAFVRALLWLTVQRREPALTTGKPWPAFVVRVLNFCVELLWPALRVIINDSVENTVPPIANNFIQRMERKPIEKITSLFFDIGDYAPRITDVRLRLGDD